MFLPKSTLLLERGGLSNEKAGCYLFVVLWILVDDLRFRRRLFFVDCYRFTDCV